MLSFLPSSSMPQRRPLAALVALAALAGALVPAPAPAPHTAVPRRRALALPLGVFAAVIAPRPTLADPPKVSERVAVPGVLPPGAEATSRGRVLKNGLKYVDGVAGAGAAPEWGQVLKIKYTAYTRDGAGKLTKVDAVPTYLVRHGNGRTIRGLDEGIHTMRVGGTRRVEVPLTMGYTAPGLGPLPEGAGQRRRLDRQLTDLEKSPENTAIVFDVGLLDAWDDDADQGFYKDNSFSGKDLTFIAEKANSIAERLK